MKIYDVPNSAPHLPKTAQDSIGGRLILERHLCHKSDGEFPARFLHAFLGKESFFLCEMVSPFWSLNDLLC